MTRSKVFSTVLGVEREQAVRHPKHLDQFRRGRYLVALFRDHQMREHDLVGVPQGRHHMGGLAVAERIETAAQRLAVDGDRRQTVSRGGFAIVEAWRRKAVSKAAGSTPRKIRRSPV